MEMSEMKVAKMDVTKEIWSDTMWIEGNVCNAGLAPEHRYPARHDDCFDVLKYLDDEENRSKSLPENVNMLHCFLAGDIAGGNLAHHVAQRACEYNFQRLKVSSPSSRRMTTIGVDNNRNIGFHLRIPRGGV
ncbi:hypothetical protein L1887_20101 [Cichorium endivia]|nr:hypothetical protein L1887_20101 [Cichorium endivia]